MHAEHKSVCSDNRAIASVVECRGCYSPKAEGYIGLSFGIFAACHRDEAIKTPSAPASCLQRSELNSVLFTVHAIVTTGSSSVKYTRYSTLLLNPSTRMLPHYLLACVGLHFLSAFAFSRTKKPLSYLCEHVPSTCSHARSKIKMAQYLWGDTGAPLPVLESATLDHSWLKCKSS